MVTTNATVRPSGLTRGSVSSTTSRMSRGCTGLTRNGVFLIEDGKVTAPVKNLRFTQSYVGALGPGKVLGVGSDVQLIAGTQLGNGSHVPSVHLAAWNFTGGARG